MLHLIVLLKYFAAMTMLLLILVEERRYKILKGAIIPSSSLREVFFRAQLELREASLAEQPAALYACA
jgi:hypothetical protein